MSFNGRIKINDVNQYEKFYALGRLAKYVSKERS